MTAAAPARSDVSTFRRFDVSTFVTVDQAAQLTGQSVRHWQRIAARAAVRDLAFPGPPPGGRGKSVWWIARKLDPRLDRCPNVSQRADRARESLYANYPSHAADLAYRKFHWLGEWRKACATPVSDLRSPILDLKSRIGDLPTELDLAKRIVTEAKRAEGESFAISVRSLQSWHASVNELGDDGVIRGVEALIDRRTDSSGATGGLPASARSDEAIDYFYRLYRTEQRFTAKTCHEMTLHESREMGRTWPASYVSTTRWLRDRDNRSLTFLCRHGADKWCRRYMPHQQIDYTLITSGQMYQTDHHQCDFWIQYRDTHGAVKQLRPWLTVVQDLRSRCIVGWHLGPSPHQDAIIAAYLMAFSQWAIPERIRIDNGKDFASELLCGATKRERDRDRARLRTMYGPDWRRIVDRDDHLVECESPKFKGITAELGIELVYAIPYAPWSKGTTERWFGTFEDQCGKRFATYCGNSALNKPECLAEIRRGYSKDQKRRLRKKYGKEWKRIAVLKFVDQSHVPTLDKARELVAEFVEQYHATPHRADHLQGRTPLAEWHGAATTLRKAGQTELLFLMQSRGPLRVGANGVSFKVGPETLSYGAGHPALYSHVGREVFITLDPHSVGCCHAFTADRKSYIGRLEANKRISPMADVDELREASATVSRRRKVQRKAARESARRTLDATAEVNRKYAQAAAERRATGTDATAEPPDITPVRTGFEAASKAAAGAPPVPRQRSRSRSETADALGYGGAPSAPEAKRQRTTLDMLTTPMSGVDQDASPDGGEDEPGTDAEKPRADIFSLLTGDRLHE